MGRLLCLVLVTWLTLTGVAGAQTCTLSVSDVNFGSVAVASGGAVDSTATATATCSGMAATNTLCLSIDAGSGGLSGTNRLMTGPGSPSLIFNLYQDAAHTLPWGSRTNSSLGTVPAKAAPGTSFTTSETIYGRVFAGQSTAPIGSYSSAFSGTTVYGYFLTSGSNCTTGTTSGFQYTSFNALATVGADCTVSASPLNFGSSSGVISTAVSASTTLSVTCTVSTSYTVGLGNGLTGTGPTSRLMKSGSNSITYGLYQNSAHTQAWGATSGSMPSGSGTGGAQSFTVFGQVAAAQTPPPGSYSDTVVVSISF